MNKFTKSFSKFLFTYHREIYESLFFGGAEYSTDDIAKEYLEWCKTDDGKKHLVGDEVK